MGLELKDIFDIEGIVRRDLLGEGIAWEIFNIITVLKAVIDLKALANDDVVIGLEILDGCHMLDSDDDNVALLTLTCCTSRNNKHFRVISFLYI